MAGDGERRMVFDVRGKRRRVVKVVYGALALLMGASLFLLYGAGNIGELFGNGSSSTGASAVFEEQATNLERKLKKDPTDDELLGALFRSRINAGNSAIVVSSTTGQQEVSPEALAQFQKASEVWPRYLKRAGEEPNPNLALLAANSFFTTATTETTTSRALENLKEASRAQQIVAKAKPTVGSLSTLAIYQYFSLDFAAGDKSQAQAKALTSSKSEAKSLTKQLADYRKRGEKFQKAVKESAKTEKSTSKEALENPLGGLAGGTGSSLAP